MPNLIEVGYVSIDSGLVHIGDPLYLADTPYKDWEAASLAVSKAENGAVQFGHTGIVITGMDDCEEYPVYADMGDDGKVKRIIIDFENKV